MDYNFICKYHCGVSSSSDDCLFSELFYIVTNGSVSEISITPQTALFQDLVSVKLL